MAAAAHGQVRFDLPAQPLAQALTTVGNLASVNVFFDPTIVRGLQAPALKAELTADDAVARILAGTRLHAVRVDDHTIRVISEPTSQRAQNNETPPTGAVYAPGNVHLASSGNAVQGPADQANSPSSKGQVAEAAQSTSSLQGGLEEVVVTAQKRQERLQEVPISISVLGGKDLDQSSYQGVTDALNTVPGVSATTSSQGGGTQIVIRGVGAAAPTLYGASTVAFYLDSVPFGFVKEAFLPDPNVFDLQRIEVLRGPQGTLYGANAENGVVRVLTNEANLNEFELKAREQTSTTDGGAGNYGGDVAINVPLIEGKLAVRGVVDYQNLSGWINGPVGTHLNDAELRSYRFKLNAQPTDALSIGFSVWSTRDDYGAAPTSTDSRTISAVLPEPISADYNTYDLKLGYQLEDFSISSATSYLGYTDRGALDLGIYGVCCAVLRGIPIFTGFYSNIFSEELLLNSAPANVWHWTAGAFYRDGRDRTFQNIPGIDLAPFDVRDSSRSYAVFGQIGRRFLSNQFEWTLGLRYFHDDVATQELVQGQGLPNVPLVHESASFNPVTPRAVLTWYPNRDWTLYASFSEGFRSGFPQNPTIAETGAKLPPAKPDKLYNYEFGAKADFLEHHISVDTSVYYIKWKDIQQSITVPYSHGLSIAALINAASASGPGVDFAVTARPFAGLELGVTLGWNDLTVDTDVFSGGDLLFAKGDRLDYSPQYTGGASAAYDFGLGGDWSGRFSVSGNYTSKQTDHLLNGAFGRINVNVGNSILTARTELAIQSPVHWRAALFVDNLTNNYGATPAFGFASPELDPRFRPRTAGLQVDYKY